MVSDCSLLCFLPFVNCYEFMHVLYAVVSSVNIIFMASSVTGHFESGDSKGINGLDVGRESPYSEGWGWRYHEIFCRISSLKTP